jgi:hypothetical protein
MVLYLLAKISWQFIKQISAEEAKIEAEEPATKNPGTDPTLLVLVLAAGGN